MKDRITGIEYSADVTIRYVGPDGMALHPGNRIGLEPPDRLKHDDRLDAWLTAMRYEMARACELPKKVMLGEDLPDDIPPDGGGLGPWRWLGFDAMKITNPEVQILGKDDRKMLNVKGIDEKELLDMPQEVAGRPERFMPQERREIAKAGNVPEKLVRDEFGPPRHDAGNIWRWPGSDAKKAEQKAKKAKRHRVAVYWQDGSERMDIVTNGEPGRCLFAVAMLLGTLLVRVPKDKRDLALRMVQGRAAALAEKYEEEGNADD